MRSNRSIVNCSTHSKLNTFRSSNTIQGINIKSSSDKNLEIDTFLDSYFNCSLNEKKYLESWSEDQLQQYWESFAEEKNIIFYSKNKMFYKLNNNEMIHSYPFLSSFDSTSNVKYINLDLKEDLFTLDKYINANMLLFGLNTKRQSFNKTFVGNLIKVRDIHDHFWLIKKRKYTVYKTNTIIMQKLNIILLTVLSFYVIRDDAIGIELAHWQLPIIWIINIYGL